MLKTARVACKRKRCEHRNRVPRLSANGATTTSPNAARKNTSTCEFVSMEASLTSAAMHAKQHAAPNAGSAPVTR